MVVFIDFQFSDYFANPDLHLCVCLKVKDMGVKFVAPLNMGVIYFCYYM